MEVFIIFGTIFAVVIATGVVVVFDMMGGAEVFMDYLRKKYD